MQNNYDLVIAYRICPKASGSPLVFGRDKYRLAELCLRSLKISLGTLRVKIWALLDGCPAKYEELFRRYFDDEDLELMRLDGLGNASTFALQMEILCKQNISDIVYLAEDDYFYLPNRFEQLVRFIKTNKGVDFVSPYDHPDYYNLELDIHVKYMRCFEGIHWRTASSTCLTFLTRKSTLQKTRSVFSTYTKKTTYAKGNSDCGVWLSLTKYGLFNPYTIVRYLVRDLMTFKNVAKAWLYCWAQILLGKRWVLWVPIPSIATHMESSCLSPGIDWMNLINLSLSHEQAEINNLGRPVPPASSYSGPQELHH